MEFFLSLLQIIMIDLVLGADNSIVIAMACRNIPVEQRNKVIFWGTAGAIIVRILLTVIIVALLNIPFLHLAGGLLLVWIAYKLLVEEENKENVKAGATVGAAIRAIITADIIMGLDNVLAIGGAAKGHYLLVVLGLLISIPIIVFGSKLVLKMFEKLPWLIYAGGGILAYTAGEMITAEHFLQNWIKQVPELYLNYAIPLVVVIVVIACGYLTNKARENGHLPGDHLSSFKHEQG